MVVSKSRNWCFTWNNFSEEAHSRLRNMKFTYMVYQEESGASGTPHLQGYVEFSSPVRLGTLKSLSNNVHWEARRGNREQAVEYCSKVDSRIGVHLEMFQDIKSART